MKITIDLHDGVLDNDVLTVRGINRNIESVQNIIDNKARICDMMCLHDTLSILNAIREELVNRRFL